MRAARYLDHSAVHHQKLAKIDTGAHLSKEARKREATKRDRLRGRTLAAYEAAIGKWKSGFGRGWSDRSLRDMATVVGLEADNYDAYGVLSGATHGSVGGLDGAIRDIEGNRVHRFGPDLELSSLAFLLGVQWWREFARSMPKTEAAQRAVTTADELLDCYEELLGETRRLDNEWWPTRPPNRRQAILAVWPNGKTRWYLLDQVASTMRIAHPPENQPDLDWLEGRIAEAQEYAARRTYAGAQQGRPLSLSVAGVVVKPDESVRRAVSASSLLVPDEFNPDPSFKPRKVRSLGDGDLYWR
ncbi:hypothetical protein GCM10027579_13690 [Calidifontibacter terrae]